ncbi:MAG: glycine zipper domain-containing protein [bacterium]
MKRFTSMVALLVIVAGAACSRNGNRSADTSLNTDLSLAAQQRRTVDSMAAVERGTQNGLQASSGSGRSVSHARSASGTVAAGSGTSTTATTSRGTVVKHTKRDAAIGAAAGAVIGATTSRNKVKGGLIGAAVGGILGGVIGNNVDKKKKP